MSLSIVQIITIVAPQYVSDADLNNTITLATQRTSDSAFGVNYTYAIALRTSHILTLRDMNSGGVTGGLGGATSAITSKKEGNTMITFGSTSGVNGTTGSKAGDLALTRYGIELLGLIAGNIPGFSLANYNNIENNVLTE